MTGRNCFRIGRARVPLLAILCLSTSLVLPGCTNLKRAVGIEQVSPDEFAVESRAPLTMPPDFDLRPPAPGTPRPQEVSTATKAREAIDAAGPGEPGKQETVGLHFSGSIPFGGGADPNGEVTANSLSSKLLGYVDKSSGDAAIENRKTTPLEGVY